MTAMRTQLADDYLIPEDLRHGIYVTAWFDTELWNDSADNRRRVARSRDRQRDGRRAGLSGQEPARLRPRHPQRGRVHPAPCAKHAQ